MKFPKIQSIYKHLTFIGCVDSTKAEEVALILEIIGIDSYKNFASPHLTNAMLLELNLKLIMVLWLRDDVAGFFQHLTQKFC